MPQNMVTHMGAQGSPAWWGGSVSVSTALAVPGEEAATRPSNRQKFAATHWNVVPFGNAPAKLGVAAARPERVQKNKKVTKCPTKV